MDFIKYKGSFVNVLTCIQNKNSSTWYSAIVTTHLPLTRRRTEMQGARAEEVAVQVREIPARAQREAEQGDEESERGARGPPPQGEGVAEDDEGNRSAARRVGKIRREVGEK